MLQVPRNKIFETSTFADMHGWSLVAMGEGPGILGALWSSEKLAMASSGLSGHVATDH